MRAILLLATALTVGAVGGLGSAYLALSGRPPLGVVRVGAWTAWPRTGSSQVDPYARAIVASKGELPLGLGEGLRFIASSDDTSAPLEAHCRYRLSGRTPTARAWTLTLFDDHGALIEDSEAQTTFTSAEVLRNADGGATIDLANEPQPGNWLRLPAGGRFAIVLRLYDTPVSAFSSALESRSMPAIERIGCP